MSDAIRDPISTPGSFRFPRRASGAAQVAELLAQRLPGDPQEAGRLKLVAAGVLQDAVPFLERVQKEHPGDFWANLILGDAMLLGRPRKRQATTGRRWQAGLERRWATARQATP